MTRASKLAGGEAGAGKWRHPFCPNFLSYLPKDAEGCHQLQQPLNSLGGTV